MDLQITDFKEIRLTTLVPSQLRSARRMVHSYTAHRFHPLQASEFSNPAHNHPSLHNLHSFLSNRAVSM